MGFGKMAGKAAPVAALVLAHAGMALAQPVPDRLPGAAEPGRQATQPPAAPKAPEAKLQFSIPTQRKGGEKPGAEIRFTLKRVLVEGASVVGPDFYDPLAAKLLGRPVTLAEVTALADAIQARYLELGHALTRAYVPAQELADGTIRIRVIEGFVSRVLVEGASPGLRDRIEARLQPALETKPALVPELERGLLLADDLPGVSLSGLLRPGDQFGAAELLVSVDEDRYGGTIGTSNRNSRFAGPWTAYADLFANGMAGMGEQVGVTLSGTPKGDEQRAAALRYLQPLTAGGLSLLTTGSYAKGAPGAALKPFAVRTRSWSVGQRAAYPLLRSRLRNAAVELGWTVNRSKVDLLGSPFTLDRWRTVDARVTWSDAAFRKGTLYATVGVVQGLDLLDASDTRKGDLTSRDNIRPEFTKFTAELERGIALAPGLTTLVNVAGQYSARTLVSGEEFTLGGARYGRGYNNGDLSGPRGLAVTWETRYAVDTGTALVPSMTLYGFADWARVWGSIALNDELASVGGGVRAELPRGVNLGLEIAQPLEKLALPGLRDPGTRYFLDLSIAF